MMLNSLGRNLKIFELRPMWRSVFFITYKDQDDLYRQFAEKLLELGIPPETVYRLDYDGFHLEVNSTEKLSEALGWRGEVYLYLRDRNEYVNSFTDCPDVTPRDDLTRKGRANSRNHLRNPFDGLDRCRRNRRSSTTSNEECFCLCHRRHSGHHDRTVFCPYFYNNPLCGPATFIPRCFYMGSYL